MNDNLMLFQVQINGVVFGAIEERTLSGGIAYVVAPSLENAVAMANRCIDAEWDALSKERRERLEYKPVVVSAKFFAPWVIDWQTLQQAVQP